MGKFAQGKYALGVSDRSGFVYKLNDMRLEWTGSLVGPDEWEKKHADPVNGVCDRYFLMCMFTFIGFVFLHLCPLVIISKLDQH